jgi:hypothetical protein
VCSTTVWMTDDWDPSIPEHRIIAYGIKAGDTVAEMCNMASARKAFKMVGYIAEMDDDLVNRGNGIPWYYRSRYVDSSALLLTLLFNTPAL